MRYAQKDKYIVGAFRLFLALLVVISHLSGGFGQMAGSVAVFCFYLISGYLITKILNATYSHGLSGLIAFAANRFLRLYPAYWTVAIFSLLVIRTWPGSAAALNPALNLPSTWINGIAQVTILGLHKIFYLNPTRFIPTAWSLNIELIYYAAIALLLGRNRWIALSWWAISVILAAHYAWTNDAHSAYFTIWGPSICFATGSVLSHFEERLGTLGDRSKLTLIACVGILAFTHDAAPSVPPIVILYIAILVGALSVVATRSSWDAGNLRRHDGWLGDLSYPVFLCHWPVSVIVASIVLPSPTAGIPLLVCSLPFVIGFSIVVNRLIEGPIRAIRNSIREAARRSTIHDCTAPTNAPANLRPPFPIVARQSFFDRTSD